MVVSMSKREFDRLEVLTDVRAGRVRVADACTVLDLRRRQLFRLYLRELKNDFRRLHAQAREIVAQSGAESAGLVEVLMKQQMIFLRATTELEFRLALQAMGIGKVDVAPFMQLIEAMRLDLMQRTAPLTAA